MKVSRKELEVPSGIVVATFVFLSLSCCVRGVQGYISYEQQMEAAYPHRHYNPYQYTPSHEQQRRREHNFPREEPPSTEYFTAKILQYTSLSYYREQREQHKQERHLANGDDAVNNDNANDDAAAANNDDAANDDANKNHDDAAYYQYPDDDDYSGNKKNKKSYDDDAATFDDDIVKGDNEKCSRFLVRFLEGTTDARDTCEGIQNAYMAAGMYEKRRAESITIVQCNAVQYLLYSLPQNMEFLSHNV